MPTPLDFQIECYKGDITKIKTMMSQEIIQGNIQGNIHSHYINDGLMGACLGGHVKIVELMLSEGARDTLCFEMMCRKGNNKIIKLMLCYYNIHINVGLQCACKSGHIDTINLLIDNGANDINGGFEYACLGGHINAVKLMISKGNICFNNGFMYAHAGGQLHIIEFLIEKGLCTVYTLEPRFNVYFGKRIKVLFRAILYQRRTKKMSLIQRDLVPSVLKLLYF